MGKATQRRERRLANELQALFTRNPQRFADIWHHYLNGWCAEVEARARGVRCGRPKASFQAVYAIPEKAERLLEAIGPEAERLVGAQTRELLEHECAKAVAKATDIRIYTFETDTVHRLMMTRPMKIYLVALAASTQVLT